jgi:hypothetical protein
MPPLHRINRISLRGRPDCGLSGSVINNTRQSSHGSFAGVLIPSVSVDLSFVVSCERLKDVRDRAPVSFQMGQL